MSKLKIPNFFILGAPKSGTTAISSYLRNHPDVFIVERKELHFFCDDFSAKYPRIIEHDDYLKQFKKSTDEKILGEASPWYMYSNCAIANAYKFNPEAKFLAIVRNPIDMLCSLHQQLLNNYDEDQTDLAKAWGMQIERSKGKMIPKSCREPKVLQYKSVCSIGQQIQKLFSIIPQKQRLVVVFDDLIKDPRMVYLQVLDFLELDDDGCSNFPVINQSFSWRYRSFSKFVYSPPKLFDIMGSNILKGIGLKRIGLFKFLNDLNEKYNRKLRKVKPLANEFRLSIASEFFNEVILLEELLERKLDGWLE